MEENRLQEESQECAQDRMTHDFVPSKKSSCALFLRSYKPYFLKNFNQICREQCTSNLCLDALNIDGDYFYDVMFNPDGDTADNEMRILFKKMILHSAHADAVLNQVWLQMTDDYVSGLRRIKGRVDEIGELTDLLNGLFRMLDETYFEISKQVNIERPRVDNTTEQYKRIITKFKKYIEHVDEYDDETGSLNIHSFYHSTPLDMAAKVVAIDQDSVTFSVHPYVAIALQRVAVAFISSPAHDDIYKAYADHVDLEKRKVRFSSFVSHNNNAEKRNHVRVELSRMTRAVIIGQDTEGSGIIYDISEVVCAVYVRSANVHDFEPGSAVRFMTKLPDTEGGKSLEIDTMATVFKSYKQGKNDLKAYRMIIQFDNNPALRLHLSNYISSRQREIVRELKELSEVIPDAELTEDSLTGEEKIAGILT